VEKSKLKMPADKEKVSGTVSAKLTLRGVTKPVNVKYAASRTGSDIHIKSASFTFKYTDFGVPEIKRMALRVDPDVTITVERVKLRE
jgi:polyisoprenoid-binding protein YceI